MDLVDIKPALDIQVILWEKWKFEQAPRWLLIQNLRLQDSPNSIELLCPVCEHMRSSKLTLDDFSLDALAKRSFSYSKVVLHPETIVEGPRKGTMIRHTSQDRRYFRYWAGQCKECRVIYWTAHEFRPPPIFLPS